MKTRVVVLAVFLFVLSQSVQAADLQAGWYVKLAAVSLFGIASGQGQWGMSWHFTSPLGTYGPFEVTHPTEPDPMFPERTVSVPTTVLGVPAGTAVYLYGQPEGPMEWPATDLHVAYETNYDSAQMILQLYVQHSSGEAELLWTEPRSGHHWGNSSVLWPWQTVLPTDTIYFRVVAVSEPSQCLALLLPTLGVLGRWRRALP